MRTISLSQGLVALVDDTDYNWLNQYKWCAWMSRHTYYAVRTTRMPNLKKQFIYMHRLILNAPNGVEVDHRDGNGLNDQRSNIRLCTHAENGRYRRLNRNNSTGFKGVSAVKDVPQKPFRVQIRVNGKVTHVGYYPTAEMAARAYDAEAVKHYGKFGLTNEMLKL